MQRAGILSHSLKKWLFVAGAASLLLLTGCDRKAQAPTAHPKPQVTYVTIQPEKIMLSTALPGRTVARRTAEIRPQVSGLIQKRLFTEGSLVTAGQVLYLIDPAPFQAALDTAGAALSRAEATLPSVKARAERFKDLVADKAVSRQDYEDAQAALIQVESDIRYYKATVKSASINLDYTRVTAPISGRIGLSSVTDGAIVTGYQPVSLATIQQLDPMYVDVAQSTTDLLRLKRRMKEGLLNQDDKDQNRVKLVLEDGTPYPLRGTLQFSDVSVDRTTGSVTLRTLFPNPEGALLPGMFVQAIIKEGMNEKAILIPQQGVSRDPKGNPYGLVVETDDKVGMRPLTLERAVGNRWLVATGLKPGDRLIVEGLMMLRPGTVVNATPFQPPQATATTPGPQNGEGDH